MKKHVSHPCTVADGDLPVIPVCHAQFTYCCLPLWRLAVVQVVVADCDGVQKRRESTRESRTKPCCVKVRGHQLLGGRCCCSQKKAVERAKK